MDDFFSGTTAATGAPAPPEQGGWAAPPPAAPVGWAAPPPPATPWPGQPAVPPRPSTGRTPSPKLLLVVGAVLVAVVAGVVAYPKLHPAKKPRSLYDRTTVTIPASVGGIPRMLGEPSRDAERQIARISHQVMKWGTPQVGLYGFLDDPSFGVVATKYRLSPAQQAQYFRDLEVDTDRRGLTSVDPGRLGGRMACVTTTTRLNECFFADEAAYGVVVILNGADPRQMTYAARSVVELRAAQ